MSNKTTTSSTNSSSNANSTGELKREISLFGGFNIITGIMIGSGIFYIGSYVLLRSGLSTGMALLVWVVGGLITLLSGICYAELGASMPETGGTYVYLRKAYGKIVAFMSGSTGFVLGSCGSLAALSVAVTTVLNNFVPMDLTTRKFVAAGLIIGLSAINYFGIKLGSLVQNTFTVAKLVPIVLIIVMGIFAGTQSVDLSITPDGVDNAGSFISSLAFAVLATFWAYEGWTNLNVVAGEIKNPKRNLPLAIITSISVVMGIYVLFNFAIYRVLSPAEINGFLGAEKLFLGTEAATKLMGNFGTVLVGVTMLVAVLGATHGCAMVFPRTIFSMSKDGSFFSPFAKVHEKYKTPSNAILLTAVISIALVFMQNLDQLTTLVTFSSILFNILVFISLFIFRKREPNMERPYKVWLYPVTPILVILIMVGMLVNTLIVEFQTSLIGLGVTLATIPLYYLLQSIQNKQERKGVE